MAKTLVKPSVSELSSEAIKTCKMIETYFSDKDVDEYSVNVEPNGIVSVTSEDVPDVEFTFSV